VCPPGVSLPAEPEEQRHVLDFPVGPDPNRRRPRSTARPGGGAGGPLGPVDSAFFRAVVHPLRSFPALASPSPPGALRRGGRARARLSSRHRRRTVSAARARHMAHMRGPQSARNRVYRSLRTSVDEG